MKAVVSGACGMIGIALSRELLKRGHEVVALVWKHSKKKEMLKDEGATIIECSLDEYGTYIPTIKADAFFHLAWDNTASAGRDDTLAQARNIGYTLDAVQLANRFGCRAFVGAGSQAEYGVTTTPLNSQTPTTPKSCYGIAKYSAGRLSAKLCLELNIRHCWARILSVYGENDTPNSLIMYLIRTLLSEQTPELTKCEQIWDYIYCTDAARALLAMAESGKDGGVYCVGSGQGRPLSEYVNEIKNCIDKNATIAFGKKDYYPHQPMLLVADIDELKADTGFEITTTFEEGIEKTIRWFKEIDDR